MRPMILFGRVRFLVLLSYQFFVCCFCKLCFLQSFVFGVIYSSMLYRKPLLTAYPLQQLFCIFYNESKSEIVSILCLFFKLLLLDAHVAISFIYWTVFHFVYASAIVFLQTYGCLKFFLCYMNECVCLCAISVMFWMLICETVSFYSFYIWTPSCKWFTLPKSDFNRLFFLIVRSIAAVQNMCFSCMVIAVSYFLFLRVPQSHIRTRCRPLANLC